LPKGYQQLLNDHETVIRSLRESANRCDQQYHDAGTVDFLTGLLEDHQKRAWMVRVHLAAQARLFRSIIPTNGIGQ